MIRDMETFNPEVCPLLTETGAPRTLRVRLGLRQTASHPLDQQGSPLGLIFDAPLSLAPPAGRAGDHDTRVSCTWHFSLPLQGAFHLRFVRHPVSPLFEKLGETCMCPVAILTPLRAKPPTPACGPSGQSLTSSPATVTLTHCICRS